VTSTAPADVAGSAHALAVRADHDQRLVDAAVVAVAVEQDLRPAGQRPHEADGPAVGVSGGQREAPALEPEAAGELGPHPLCVLGRQHRGDAAQGADAVLYGGHGRRRRVPRHGAGVPEREVDVLEAIDVPDAVAQGPLEVDREAPGLLVHPGHRHVAEQMPRSLVCRPGSRVLGIEVSLLSRVHPSQPDAVDHDIYSFESWALDPSAVKDENRAADPHPEAAMTAITIKSSPHRQPPPVMTARRFWTGWSAIYQFVLELTRVTPTGTVQRTRRDGRGTVGR